MNKTNPSLWEGDLRALSDAEQERLREGCREFGRQLMADRAKYAGQEQQILQAGKEKKLAARRQAYSQFQARLGGTKIALQSILTGMEKWRDDLKFADTAELIEIRALLKQMEKFTAPVGDTFSDELPISLPVRHDRPIPDGYHFADWTGTWMRDGY